MERFKIIHDTVHGSIRVRGVFLGLLESPELQRLNGISQLGLAHLVFPGANHTRLEHSMGTAWVARKLGRALDLPADEVDLLTAAALLHDVGHGPFSHTLEAVLHHKLRIDHMDLTVRVIRGEDTMVPKAEQRLGGMPTVEEILERHGLDPAEVADIAAGRSPLSPSILDWQAGHSKPRPRRNEKRYLRQLVHGPLDADQMDFLMRDSHYTGVAHGAIDMERIMNTMALSKGELVIHEKGVPAIEGMLVARGLMYSSIYFHKTVRIAELMLSRAVEGALKGDMAEIQKMTDNELLAWLRGRGEYQKRTVLRLKYRMLMKRAYGLNVSDVTEDRKERLLELASYDRLRRVEDDVCDRAGLPPGSVVIDLPQPELLLSEPRINKTGVKVLTHNGVRYFAQLSPFGKALEARNVSRWVLMVATDKEHVQKVQKIAERVLFG
ncbi:MAG: HD domain-containing protein [Euryarchaeota archaeon]|nr:HD domain-containing protein [Euryarchaeota archaeon]